MDVERITVTCSTRRLVNSVKKLHTREIISSKRYHNFNFAEEHFRDIQLQEEYHTYNPEEYLPFSLPAMNQRSKIIKLFSTGDVVFALAQSGVCTTFSRETGKRICFLNVSADEVIRRLFYNETNDSVITISFCASERISSLIYRTTNIKYIRRGEPNSGFRLFESESMKWPSIVEFDGVNEKIIMYFTKDKIYKVFDLKTYVLLYSILDNEIEDIKISLGFLLLVYKKNCWGIPLKIVLVEDGTVLKSFTHKIHENKEVVLIQPFNEKLLFKQESRNLQIVDVRNSEVTYVSQTEFLCPFSLILWHENQLLLTVINQRVMVWNLRGELVTLLQNRVIRNPYYTTKKVYITSNGELIIASSHRNGGSIDISNILTGKCVRKITEYNSSKCTQASKIRSTVAEVLESITFLTYDEERNEIFTGNILGEVHVWTN